MRKQKEMKILQLCISYQVLLKYVSGLSESQYSIAFLFCKRLQLSMNFKYLQNTCSGNFLPEVGCFICSLRLAEYSTCLAQVEDELVDALVHVGSTFQKSVAGWRYPLFSSRAVALCKSWLMRKLHCLPGLPALRSHKDSVKCKR